jgi:hypothetical protein
MELTLDQIIMANKGKILTVVFRKKDGSIRTLNGIYGVSRYLAGGDFKGDPRQYIVLWDIRKKDYRSVNRSTLMEVRVDKRVFKAKV